jgi:probable F420-dependent oxidoreductase
VVADSGGERLSVRVGVGLSVLGAAGIRDGSFWDVVGTLEDVGYDSLWLSDVARLGGLSPLPTLAAVAARTERLKLGTNVLVLPPRNPLLLARELATVDVLSSGRLLPAGGLGIDLPGELEATGVARGERTARLEESVAVIKALWRGEPVTMNGRFWSYTDVTLNPRPHRQRLELWLGGLAPAALRRIGRIADGWIGSFVSPPEFGAGVEIIRASAAEHGRTIDEDHFGTTIFSAPSEDEVPATAVPLLGRRPELALEDYVAYGADGTRALLERFITAGATKFVLIPLAADPAAWLRELFPRAIAPLEERGVARR